MKKFLYLEIHQETDMVTNTQKSLNICLRIKTGSVLVS